MGVMVTCDKIIEKVIETKADILGLSGKTGSTRRPTPSLPHALFGWLHCGGGSLVVIVVGAVVGS